MSYRTVGQVKAYAAQMLHQSETATALAGSTAEGTQDLIERWMSLSFDRIVSHFSWSWLQDTRDFTWPTIVSGEQTSVFYLPDFVYRLLSLFPQSISYREPVLIMNRLQFDNARPGNTIGRGQDILVPFGYYGVSADPIAGVVNLVSSVAGLDNGAQIRIEGLTGTGNNVRSSIETVTLAGSGTGVTATSFAGGQGGVRRVSVVRGTVPTAGGGILTASTGGTTIETLDISREVAHEHIRTGLYAQIGGPCTYKCSYYRRPYNVDDDNSYIDIPHEFHDLLELGIMSEHAKFRGEWANSAGIDRKYDERLRALRGWDNHQPGQKRRVKAAAQWGTRRRF